MLLSLGASLDIPQFTRDGAARTRADDVPRYDPETCFAKAGVAGYISASREYWIKPPRRPSARYAWAPRAEHARDRCLHRKGHGVTIEVPSATEVRKTLRNHTVVVVGDSFGLQTFVSLAALLVCGGDDGNALPAGAKFADRSKYHVSLPEYGTTVQYVNNNFGVAATETADKSRDAWYMRDGKKQAMRRQGRKHLVWPYGRGNEAPRAPQHVEDALEEYRERERVTYAIVYGHWLAQDRSDVVFFNNEGKRLMTGKRPYNIYKQTHKVLASTLAAGMRPSHDAVFFGYSPIQSARPGHDGVCAGGTSWSRAAKAGLAAAKPEGDNIHFLDMECPLARLPRAHFAKGSDSHRHLPGGPDLENAIFLRFVECEDARRREAPPRGNKTSASFSASSKLSRD